LEVRLQLWVQGDAIGSEVQEAAQAGGALPSISVYFGDQFVPTAMPGLLG
jgi:hypothetical protein